MTNALFAEGSNFRDTLIRHPEVAEQLKEFMRQKNTNPLAAYGKSDTSFVGSALKGYRHAHLTRDLSLIYRLTGSHPRVFKMYGIYSHAELGTGTPGNPRKQKSIATQFANSTFA